jgi:hypothetical protein
MGMWKRGFLYCLVLGAWVFIKSRKGGKGGVFAIGVEGVLGQLYIGYGTLIETLFSIGHMSCLVKKR